MSEIEEPHEIERYGHGWAYGAGDSAIELTCFRNYGAVPDWDTGHTRTFHFERAIQILLPEKTPQGKPLFVMSKWDERRIQSLCDPERHFQTWWGGSSTGKSTTAAAFFLVYYLAAPDETTVQICSTSVKSLRMRVWAEVMRFYEYILSCGPLPMESFRGGASPPALRYRPKGSKDASERIGIFGRAVQKGAVDDAKADIQGVHATYNALMVDECAISHMWPVVEVFDNIASGREALFLGTGNPIRTQDPLCRASRPKNGRWDSINMNMDEWDTEKGVCLYFNGLKSPGVAEPDKYFFLKNQKQIDDMRRDPGENTPRWYTMVLGWVPPEGMTETIFTQELIERHNLKRKVKWVEQPVGLAAMDGAFTIGGDRAVLATAFVGATTDGNVVIQFNTPIVINIELNEGEPIAYFLVRKVRQHCEAHGIPATRFGLDVSSTQTVFGDIFTKEWGAGWYGCQFGGAATGQMVSNDDKRKPSDVYANRATQLWMDVRSFSINGQIAGMQDDACNEFCNRLVDERGGKMAIESKKEYKDRTGESPDIADGHVILIAMAKDILNMAPGKQNIQATSERTQNEEAKAVDVDREEDAYTGDSVTGGNWNELPLV